MNASKVGPGELIAGVGGLALFLFLFLDWFGPVSAWEGFDVVDILLAAIGLGAAGLAAARAAGVQLGLPGGSGAATALAGFAAAVIALTFLLEGEERKIGIWLALVASLGITYLDDKSRADDARLLSDAFRANGDAADGGPSLGSVSVPSMR
jgi:TRAP-type uncharacterized transport system fused permease subunit